jgi:hypothetical protein
MYRIIKGVFQILVYSGVLLLSNSVTTVAQVHIPDLLVSSGKAVEASRTLLHLRFERERCFSDSGDLGIEGIAGNASLADGFKENGARFNGINTSVTIPSHPSLKALTEGPFTIDFHLFMEKLPEKGDVGIIGLAQPGFVIFTNQSGWLYCYLVTTEQPWHISVATGLLIKPGQWHHVRFSYDGREKIRWRLDDTIKEDTQSTKGAIQIPREDYAMVLGRYHKNYFNGVLDEVRIMTGFDAMTEEVAERTMEKSLALYVPFDGTLNAEYARGEKKPLYYDESVRFTEGIKGNAVLLKGEGIAYTTEEHINRSRGTLMFWFRGFDPTDYTARRYARFKSFFEVGSWNEAMRLYWPGNGMGMLFYEFICMGAIRTGHPLRMMSFNPEDRWISRDKWHHIAVTWVNGEEANFYFDGRHIFTIKGINLPAELSSDFVLGRGTPELEMDELKIYEEALSSGMIRKIYGELEGSLRKTLISDAQPITGSKNETAYAPGLLKEPWYDNGLGEEDEVPPPWEPLKVKDVTVSSWGATINCDGILPQKIMMRDGTNILNFPISFRVSSFDGKILQIPLSKAELTSQGKSYCTFESTAVAEEYTIRSKKKIEFDGFLINNIEVEIQKDLRLGKLWLDIPIKREYAKYYNICGTWPSYLGIPSGRIPSAGMQKGFEPCIWVGDEDRGFAICTEENNHWVNRATDRVIELLFEGDTLMVRLNLCDEELSLKKGQKLSYKFGFLATPSRPFISGRRLLRVGGLHPNKTRRGIEEKNRYVALQWTWSAPWMSFYPKNKDTFAQWAKQQKELEEKFEKVYITPYLNLQKFGYQAKGETERDWYIRYKDVMALAPAAYNIWPHGENDWSKTFNFCPNSKAFQDFFIWSFKRFLDQAPTLNGVYIDETFTYICVSDKHGCRGKNLFGEATGTFPIFAHRELMKRMYKVAKKKDPNFLFWTHDSQFLKPPQRAFSDISSGGEPIHFLTTDPLESLPLDRIKAEFLGRQWGVISLYLPEVTKPNSQSDTLLTSERLLHLLFLHDIQTWGIWIHGFAMEDIWEVANKYGIDDSTEFIPYWQLEEGKRKEISPMGPVKVSIYRIPKKKHLLLTVYNTADTPFKGKINANWKALGVGDTEYKTLAAEIVSGARSGKCTIEKIDATGIEIDLGAKDGANIVVSWSTG